MTAAGGPALLHTCTPCLPGCSTSLGWDHLCHVHLGHVERPSPYIGEPAAALAVEADQYTDGDRRVVLAVLGPDGRYGHDLIALDPAVVPRLVTLLLQAYKQVRS